MFLDIFLTKSHRVFFEGFYETPGAVWITFMMDGCAFLGFYSRVLFTPIIKLGKSRIF